MIDGLLSVAQTVAQPLLSYLLPFSRTFNALVKRLAGSPKVDLTLTKCYSKVARILIYDGLLSVAQTVPKPLLSYLLPFSRSIALVKRLAGSPKG
jgi:hypothetical protein